MSWYHPKYMRTTILFLIAILACTVAAQTRTVTNSDLAKFAEKRIKAEREYRENYERLGMPSPEELDRINAADAKEREELSERLRAERLRQESINAQREAAAAMRRPMTVYVEQRGGGYYTSYPYFYGGVYSYPSRRHYRVKDPLFNHYRGDRTRSYYPWMIIRTPTVTPTGQNRKR